MEEKAAEEPIKGGEAGAPCPYLRGKQVVRQAPISVNTLSGKRKWREESRENSKSGPLEISSEEVLEQVVLRKLAPGGDETA